MVKLLDYSARWNELVVNSNPFALVVMAHRQAVKTDQNSPVRVDAKVELARLLGLRRYSETETQELFRFIDWLLQLSISMQPLYEEKIAAMKEQKPMTYISTIERNARAEGLLTGLEVGLKLKFGDAGLALLPTVSQITDPDTLERLLHTLAECDSLVDFQCAIPHA